MTADDEPWKAHEGCDQRIADLEERLRFVLTAYDHLWHRFRTTIYESRKIVQRNDNAPALPTPPELRARCR